jgi:hypothetical protein
MHNVYCSFEHKFLTALEATCGNTLLKIEFVSVPISPLAAVVNPKF